MWGLLNYNNTSTQRFVYVIGLWRFTGCCVQMLRGGGQPSSWASHCFSEPSCLNPIVLNKFHISPISTRWSYWRTERHFEGQDSPISDLFLPPSPSLLCRFLQFYIWIQGSSGAYKVLSPTATGATPRELSSLLASKQISQKLKFEIQQRASPSMIKHVENICRLQTDRGLRPLEKTKQSAKNSN